MKTLGIIFGTTLAWYILLALFAVQQALGGFWLLLPLAPLFIFTILVSAGVTPAVTVSALIGLGLDLYMPFPFGTFLLAYPAAVLALYFLFQTVFTQETSFSTLLTIGSGILLADLLSWLFMHILFFFQQNGDVLSLNTGILVLAAERMLAGAGLYLLLLIIWRTLFQRLFISIFIRPTHGIGR